ncbi:MAG: SAM-dependent methyltransferase [Rhodobacteraceae bacterium]|nr:SAM-dependent methyltransferase [Paracoccaceae bacterium]
MRRSTTIGAGSWRGSFSIPTGSARGPGGARRLLPRPCDLSVPPGAGREDRDRRPPPRGNRAWPRVGIFAQRGRNRPNRLGLTTCRIVAVLGTELAVAGLDAIDGTPVLDLKPAMSGFDRPDPLAEPDWAREIMADYWREGGDTNGRRERPSASRRLSDAPPHDPRHRRNADAVRRSAGRPSRRAGAPPDHRCEW